jgi:hypothetical protein
MDLFLPKKTRLFLCLAALVLAFPQLTYGKHSTTSFSHFDYPQPVWNRPGTNNEGRVKDKFNQEQAQILQLCLDLPALQPYYPKATDGTYQQVYILQHGISFPSDTEVYKAGKPAVFIEKARLADGKIDAYFLFHEFVITGNGATVEFVFNYDQTSSRKRLQVVSLDLQKTGNTWTVVHHKIEGRDS